VQLHLNIFERCRKTYNKRNRVVLCRIVGQMLSVVLEGARAPLDSATGCECCTFN